MIDNKIENKIIDIEKLLEKQFEEEDKKFEHLSESYNRFFISGVGFTCSYAKYMNILSPRPFSSKIRKKMLRGTIYHDYIENLITKNSNNVISEKDGRCKLHKEYNNKYVMYGRCDLIILGLNNKNVPIEIKSFDDKWGTKYIPNSIHELQLQIYMDILNVSYGYLCYISQNFDDYWYKIDRNGELINEIINKYNKLSDNLKNKIIPEKIKSWECGWCKYRIDCVFE